MIIAITRPEFFTGEAERINEILSAGKAHYLHIRKPEASAEEIENLIFKVDRKFYKYLKLHDHFELINKYDLGGVHINNRNRDIPENAKSVSISLHDLESIDKSDIYDYFFISPVFDSISKPGYYSAFNLTELSQKIKGKNAIALGGVTPEKFKLLSSLGFQGAALLGHFFPVPHKQLDRHTIYNKNF